MLLYDNNKKKGAKGEGLMFSNKNQLITAYQTGNIDTHAVAKVRIDGKLVETTPGRVMFTTMLPPEVRDYGATYGKKTNCKINRSII